MGGFMCSFSHKSISKVKQRFQAKRSGVHVAFQVIPKVSEHKFLQTISS